MTATEEDIRARFAEAVEAADPRIHILHLIAFMDDGRTFEDIAADQRDMRRGMIALGTTDAARDPLGFVRAQAWANLTRTGRLEMGWADFDRQTIEVTPRDEIPVEAVDPTGPGPAG
jgi:hypothetical protein